MKRTLFYFLILLAAVWLGVIIHNNPGYVLLSFNNWTIETSLWFAIIALVIIFVVLLFLLRLGKTANGIVLGLRKYFTNRRQRKARARTTTGLYDLVEGKWKSAERNLIKAALYSDMPMINYLAAALMAQKQNAYDRAENYLRHAQNAPSSRYFAVGLTQARLQIINKKWEEALATLQALHQKNPKNKLILELLQKVCIEVGEWHMLRDLVPALRKHHVLPMPEINQLEQKVWRELLTRSINDKRTEIVWQQMPRYLHRNQAILAIYCSYLITANLHDEAEALIKLSLRKNLDKKLLDLYSSITSDKPLRKLARAEEWLEKNPQDAHLLLSLGQICKNLKLWGKARHYLEMSAKLAPTPEVFYELGKIMVAQNDSRAAIEYFSKGLDNATQREG
jgi:HemY protein